MQTLKTEIEADTHNGQQGTRDPRLHSNLLPAILTITIQLSEPQKYYVKAAFAAVAFVANGSRVMRPVTRLDPHNRPAWRLVAWRRRNIRYGRAMRVTNETEEPWETKAQAFPLLLRQRLPALIFAVRL